LDLEFLSCGRNPCEAKLITLDRKLIFLEEIMNIIVWVVLGLLAGAIAKAVYPGYQGGGILSTMILGIVGAFIGGSLLTLLQTGTLHLTAAGAGLSITGILVAVLGAIIAIYLWGLLRRSSNA
jgi:uncharacterized membrane protein YeaQ/YmgE (transglycosylase-associated protein family)